MNIIKSIKISWKIHLAFKEMQKENYQDALEMAKTIDISPGTHWPIEFICGACCGEIGRMNESHEHFDLMIQSLFMGNYSHHDIYHSVMYAHNRYKYELRDEKVIGIVGNIVYKKDKVNDRILRYMPIYQYSG